MLGSVATCLIVTIEIGALTYSLHRQGVFKDIKNKFFTKKRDYQEQEQLRRITWNTYSH